MLAAPALSLDRRMQREEINNERSNYDENRMPFRRSHGH